MDDTPRPVDDRTLRFLRLLVTVLTATMILGLLVIITLLVIRFSDSRLPLPDRIELPGGVTATAFTRGDGWFAVVTGDDRILIYNAETGTLVQQIAIERGE